MLTTIAQHHKESCISSENAVAWPQTCFCLFYISYQRDWLLARSSYRVCVQKVVLPTFCSSWTTFILALVVKNRDAWSVHTLHLCCGAHWLQRDLKFLTRKITHSLVKLHDHSCPKLQTIINFLLAWWQIMNWHWKNWNSDDELDMEKVIESSIHF